MIIIGVARMNKIVETDYSYITTKTNNHYKIAFISDTHYDTIQNTKYIDETVDKLNTYDLDLLILDNDKHRKKIPRKSILLNDFESATIYSQSGIQMDVDYSEIFYFKRPAITNTSGEFQ